MGNKMHTNEMESSKDEKETGMIFDRNKCDVWDFGELDVPKLEEESIDKSNSNEIKSSADEEEAPVVFDRNKFDTWNFEDLGVPNLLETSKDEEEIKDGPKTNFFDTKNFEKLNDKYKNKEGSSDKENEIKEVFDRNKFDSPWNFEDLGVPNLLETDNQSDNATI